ncbi:hypothetical protein KOW79_001860 [Hemibagrus wyckioides]|uniref:Uncharacterized protein n=1 Tax=Hemibagrus wyckioides TaxID=337641 RepID=A0A9D3P834_9TELE|nr:hypothetical protein KOW79_001860 [Hemibagrus wyckioides]
MDPQPSASAPASPAQKTCVPLPKQLMFLVPEQSAATQTKRPISTAADNSTVESSPVCRTLFIVDCGKDETLSSLETTSYSIPHRAEASHDISRYGNDGSSVHFFHQQGPVNTSTVPQRSSKLTVLKD